jgi:pimeloyl-ACP methyl ester carboxylesterase
MQFDLTDSELLMMLLPWAHVTSAGFTLRGWHSPPSGKPLLHFLHGNGFCCRTYDPLLARLAEHFDLWLCDLQGHGESDHGGVFLGWNRNAELAREAFDAGLDRFGDVPRFACGHSFGGVLTSLILSKHPDLFERAVLLDPVIFPPRLILARRLLHLLGVKGHAVSRKARTRRSHWPDRPAAHAALLDRGMFKGWERAAFDAHIEHALRDRPGTGTGVELKCRPEREAEVFESMPGGLWRALRRIRTPVHVLRGANSYPFVAESANRFASLNAKVSAAELLGGHCFMLEDSEAAASATTAYLLEDDRLARRAQG